MLAPDGPDLVGVSAGAPGSRAFPTVDTGPRGLLYFLSLDVLG
jgi:hypothetical protein